MESEIERLKNIIEDKNRLLFNAFSLARPEVFTKLPPYDYEYLVSVTSAFYEYLDELDRAGKNELQAG